MSRRRMTVAGVAFVPAINGWAGRPTEQHPLMFLRKYDRGLFRWGVGLQGMGHLGLVGRGTTAREAVTEALAHPAYVPATPAKES